MLEIEADLALESPAGLVRLAGQGREIVLELPREASLRSLWSCVRPLGRPAAAATRFCSIAGLSVTIKWRNLTVGRAGADSPRWLAVRPSFSGILLALASGPGVAP